MRFAPEQTWRQFQFLWEGWPGWLQASVIIAVTVVAILALSMASRMKPRRGSRRRDIPPARSDYRRYRYLEVFSDINEAIAWLLLIAVGGFALVLLFVAPVAGLLILVAGFLFFLGMIVWSDAIRLFMDIEAHLRALRNELPSAVREVASASNDKRSPDE